MDEETIRALAQLVEKSLQSAGGQKWLISSHARLMQSYIGNSFNTDRAQEIYTIAIERSVLSDMPGSLGYMTMKTLRESGITGKMASELVAQFKTATGATDQRPTRKGFWAKIAGK